MYPREVEISYIIGLILAFTETSTLISIVAISLTFLSTFNKGFLFAHSYKKSTTIYSSENTKIKLYNIV